MKSTTSIAFIAGAVIGGLVGYYISKNKFEQIAQEELNAKRAVAAKERKEKKDQASRQQISEDYINPRKLARESMEKPSIVEYGKKLEEVGYKDYQNGGEIVKPEPKKIVDNKIYAIPKDELGELGYDRMVLNLYSDGTLADESDEIVDIASTVGEDFEDYIGQYENDSAFIRNEKTETDYEIYRDERSFKEVSG